MEFTLILNNKTLFRDFWNSDFDSNSGERSHHGLHFRHRIVHRGRSGYLRGLGKLVRSASQASTKVCSVKQFSS